MGTFRDLSSKMEALKAEFKEAGKEAVQEEFADFFKQYPQVEAVRWQQYVPGFNDGDPCTFSVRESSVLFSADTQPEALADGEFHEGYDFEDDHPKINEALGEIDSLLHSNSDLLQTMFGTNVEITITPKEITVDDYDCGY